MMKMNDNKHTVESRLNGIRSNTEKSNTIKVGDKVRVIDQYSAIRGAVGTVTEIWAGPNFIGWETVRVSLDSTGSGIREYNPSQLEKLEPTPPPPMPPSAEDLLKEPEEDPIAAALAFLAEQRESVSEQWHELDSKLKELDNAIDALESL